MKNYKLSIELLSDLCVTDGGVYNSSIDTDICYDKYGLPYIPAKRIKGCLRECAVELADWGVDIKPDILFGKRGNRTNSGKVRVSDAHLALYDEYVSEIEDGRSSIYHPQNVLANFSYVRNQISIDDETGVAKANFLRSIRVANKGLIFETDISLIDESEEENLRKCTKLLKNMGLARTRGLGEVKAELIPHEIQEEQVSEKSFGDENMLFYKLELLEPMICKSINGGEANSLDYIEGSKIMGLLANAIKDDSRFIDVLSDKTLVFSNAYIEKNGRRMIEVPAYLYTIKNNKTNYINRLFYKDRDTEKPNQINGMKHCYVSFNGQVLDKVSVDMEERYHHSRPADKSIGHANDTTDSKFYQISSINNGQTFSGFIKGNQETLKLVYDYLSKIGICYMGYGSGSEYGKCKFSISPYKSECDNEFTGKDFVVTLTSPAIVYNTHSMYSTNLEDLLEEILVSAGLDVTEIGKINREMTQGFMKYTNLGGYNVTWNARKPVISAFDKGTSIKLVFDEEVTMKTGQFMFIGERNQEGFGECNIEPLNVSGSEADWIYAEEKSCRNGKDNGVIGTLGSAICRRLFEEHIKISAAQGISGSKLIKENMRSTVSNMLLMCKEMDSMDQIRNAVKDRFDKTSDLKRDKKENAENILNIVKEKADTATQSFCEQMNLDRAKLDLKDDEISKIYLQALLMELKYQIRAKKGEINE